MGTEDTATLLLRFANGARGSVAVSQISAGRKNSLQWEIDGSDGAAWWDSETPDHLWLGHRDRPNELLLRNPALMGRPGAAAAVCPAVTWRASATRSEPLFRAIYADVLAGRPSADPPYADFAAGHDEMLVNDAIALSAASRRWVDVDRSPGTTPAVPQPPASPHHDGGPRMRLGLLTAPFPSTPLAEVVDWTAANGFESIEIACWPPATGPTRRYAGTSHIDVANLGPSRPRTSPPRSGARAW